MIGPNLIAELAHAARTEAQARAERAAQRPGKTAKERFRSSMAWRRARYAVLAANAERHGGIATCELCGTQAAPGAPLHVDHIEPVSKNWGRRFDRSNLQVLCGECNTGKLAGPARDFRKS